MNETPETPMGRETNPGPCVGAQIGGTMRLIDRLLDEGHEEVNSDA